MAYVRERGNQLCIVHGARDPKTGKVQQEILFTIYSKEEALAAIGKSNKGQPFSFEGMLEGLFPGIKFNWKAIHKEIETKLAVLPENYEYRKTRATDQFYPSLCSFAKTLLESDPQELIPAAQLIQQHRFQLEYVKELIAWRLELRDQKEHSFNRDNPFYWRSSMSSAEPHPDIEEEAESFYDKGELDRAEAVFTLLTDCYESYADGHWYLGKIAMDRGDAKRAITYFQKAVELGRKLFPKKIGRKMYWADHTTRPYMRGLINLAYAYMAERRFDEALAICDKLEQECGDTDFANLGRGRIYLNLGKWAEARQAATKLHQGSPAESFIIAYAAFEMGQHVDALTHFIFAALHKPHTARMLIEMKSSKPNTRDSVDDHNDGIYLYRYTRWFRERQSSASLKFFKSVMKDARVVALLARIEKLDPSQPTKDHDAASQKRQQHEHATAWTTAQEHAARLVATTLAAPTGI